jgi:hypothetical protein
MDARRLFTNNKTCIHHYKIKMTHFLKYPEKHLELPGKVTTNHPSDVSINAGVRRLFQ